MQRERLLQTAIYLKDKQYNNQWQTDNEGVVIYWMQREQRVQDNWALYYAYEQANKRNVPLLVYFGLADDFLGAAKRSYQFMLGGLVEVFTELAELNISYIMRQGDVVENLVAVTEQFATSIIVVDFNPLHIRKQWNQQLLQSLPNVAVVEVDAHNIVPCWIASNKQEYGAYTIRPKLNRMLCEYLHEIPRIEQLSKRIVVQDNSVLREAIAANSRDKSLIAQMNKLVKPGTKAAFARLNHFIKHKLDDYDQARNNPNLEGQSGMSAYLHFGQIAAQRIALAVQKASASQPAKDGYLEELIVRRELSDNYCYYNENYDNVLGFPEWARKTLAEHRADERNYIYTEQEFADAKTHDPLWNRAQLDLLETGTINGYMRMYWAKKILEWTSNPEQAMQIAIKLNDTYALDGRDPNGYVGIAWSIGGVHDRAWKERPVYGKVRYMNESGCKRKFDVLSYVNKT